MKKKKISCAKKNTLFALEKSESEKKKGILKDSSSTSSWKFSPSSREIPINNEKSSFN